MARLSGKKRRYQWRPGLVAAARKLGCEYSHLRRVVIQERRSKSLIRRYRWIKAGRAEVAGTKSKERNNQK
jgi:hypothetical protein